MKTVKLTQRYINAVKRLPKHPIHGGYPTQNGKIFCHFQKLPEGLVEGDSFNFKDLVDNPDNVPITNLQGDVIKTVNYNDFYTCDENDEIEVPEDVFNKLKRIDNKGNEIGILQEVI